MNKILYYNAKLVKEERTAIVLYIFFYFASDMLRSVTSPKIIVNNKISAMLGVY